MGEGGWGVGAGGYYDIMVHGIGAILVSTWKQNMLYIREFYVKYNINKRMLTG